MERGATKSCSLENLDKLCRFLNCTLNDIYEFSSNNAKEIVIPLKVDENGKVDPFIKYTDTNDVQADQADTNVISDQISALSNIFISLDPISQAKLLVYADELKSNSSKTNK